MKKLVVLLMAMLVATSAMAVADPDDNSIGLYFDTTGDLNCTTATPGLPLMAYIVLTNCTYPAVSFYEFGYRLEAGGLEASIFRLASLVANGDPAYSGIDIGSGTPALGDHIVGLNVGMPAQPAMVLHAWQLLLLAPMSVDVFMFQSSAPSLPGTFPVILDDLTKELHTVGQSTGGADTPVAQINPPGDCVVSVEAASFGSVKSLYR
jgi:hypothetical protein